MASQLQQIIATVCTAVGAKVHTPFENDSRWPTLRCYEAASGTNTENFEDSQAIWEDDMCKCETETQCSRPGGLMIAIMRNDTRWKRLKNMFA